MSSDKWININRESFSQAPGYLSDAESCIKDAISAMSTFDDDLRATGFYNRTSAYNSSISSINTSLSNINTQTSEVDSIVNLIITKVDAYDKGLDLAADSDLEIVDIKNNLTGLSAAIFDELVEDKNFLEKAWDWVTDKWDKLCDAIEAAAATFVSTFSSILMGIASVAETLFDAAGLFLLKVVEVGTLIINKLFATNIDISNFLEKSRAFIARDFVSSAFNWFLGSKVGSWSYSNRFRGFDLFGILTDIEYSISVGEITSVPEFSTILTEISKALGVSAVSLVDVISKANFTVKGEYAEGAAAQAIEGFDGEYNLLGNDKFNLTDAQMADFYHNGKLPGEVVDHFSQNGVGLDFGGLSGVFNGFIEYALESVTDSFVGPTQPLYMNNNSMVGSGKTYMLGNIPLGATQQAQLATFKGNVGGGSGLKALFGGDAAVSVPVFGLGIVASVAGTSAAILGTGSLANRGAMLMSSGAAAGGAGLGNNALDMDDPRKLRTKTAGKTRDKDRRDDDDDDEEDEKKKKASTKPKVKISGGGEVAIESSTSNTDVETLQTGKINLADANYDINGPQEMAHGADSISKFKPKFKSILATADNLASLAGENTENDGPKLHITNVGPKYVTVEEVPDDGTPAPTKSRSYVFDSEEVNVENPNYKWTSEEPTVQEANVNGLKSNIDPRIAAREAASSAFEAQAVATSDNDNSGNNWETVKPNVQNDTTVGSNIDIMKERAREVAANEFEQSATRTGKAYEEALRQSARETAANEFERTATSTKSVANFAGNVNNNGSGASSKPTYELGNITYTSLSAIVTAEDNDKYNV